MATDRLNISIDDAPIDGQMASGSDVSRSTGDAPLERQERIRQLASVCIEMFKSRRGIGLTARQESRAGYNSFLPKSGEQTPGLDADGPKENMSTLLNGQ